MKKFLLIAIFIISCTCSFANIQQGNWRWRKDYGPEHLDAPQGANQDIPITITSADSAIRLRIEFSTSDDGGVPIENNLYYFIDTIGGQSIRIDATDTSHAFVLGTLDSESSSEQTTEQLIHAYGYGGFVPGLIMDAASSPTTRTLSRASTEYEWILRPTKNIKPRYRYVFFSGNNTTLSSNSPSLTVAGVLPVTFLSFTVQNENGKALIRWATANEQNADRFEVWRSGDGSNWTLLSTTKAINNTGSGSYQVYDDAPLPGKSYYKVKQYNKDGSATNTSVQILLRDALQAVQVLVYPNPFAGSVLVQIPSQTSAVKSTIKVIDLQGRVWLTESAVTGSVQIGSTLPKGIYRLQVWQNKTLVYHTTLLKQ